MYPRYAHPADLRTAAAETPLARYCKNEGLDLFQLLSSGDRASVCAKAASGTRFLFGLFKGPGR